MPTAADDRAVSGPPAIDADLARRLVDTQFPQWAGLPLRLADPAGSDDVIYWLGEELPVRLPRHAGAIRQARKELEWLPRLVPYLPLAVPVPLAVGEPAFDAAVNPRVAAQTTRQITAALAD